VHSDAVIGQTHEPCHRRADEVRPARRRIDSAADAPPHHAPGRIDEITINGGAVILVLFQDMETAGGRRASAFAGGNGRVDRDFVSKHEIGTLFRDRNYDMRIVRCDLVEQTGANVDWVLALDQVAGGLHRTGRGRHPRLRAPKGTLARSGHLCPRINQRQSDQEQTGGRFCKAGDHKSKSVANPIKGRMQNVYFTIRWQRAN